MNNSKLTNIANLFGNASQIIIASSILTELYFKFRNYKKTSPEHNPDDDGDLSPTPQSTPLAA